MFFINKLFLKELIGPKEYSFCVFLRSLECLTWPIKIILLQIESIDNIPLLILTFCKLHNKTVLRNSVKFYLF